MLEGEHFVPTDFLGTVLTTMSEGRGEGFLAEQVNRQFTCSAKNPSPRPSLIVVFFSKFSMQEAQVVFPGGAEKLEFI